MASGRISSSRIGALVSIQNLALVLGCASGTVAACGLQANGDGTMTDPLTRIQVQICPVGQQWLEGRCEGTAVKHTFESAMRSFAQADWRLITRFEAERMASRLHGCKLSGVSWTSTLVPGSSAPWFIIFDNGNLGSPYRYNESEVRLVRMTPPVTRQQQSDEPRDIESFSRGATTVPPAARLPDDPKARGRSARVQ